MKSIFIKNKQYLIILFAGFLLQSCNTYKTIDLEQTQLIKNEFYKIKQRHKFVKVQMLELKSTTMVVLDNAQRRRIVKADIKKIKVRKPSIFQKIYCYPRKVRDNFMYALQSIS
ncbi:MAG: hypothetical protein PSV16_15865 [Flavobacterium sp.]|nr:hypothetical protein [Flavobacterium sp.]